MVKSRDFRVPSEYFYHLNNIFYQEGKMGTQLNIKSEDAYRLASELAELTGENLTAAVTAALRERLERERKARDVEAKVERMMAMAREIRAHMREPVSSDHSWLYDENGLPK